MKTEQPKAIKLQDYTPPAFLIDHVDLEFFLEPEGTRVKSLLKVRRNPDSSGPLHLDGDTLELLSIAVDGRALQEKEYLLDEFFLEVEGLPDKFELAIETRIDPVLNTRLEGLYLSGGNFCTQCEAEGFRRITFYPDRPDVMATYSVTMQADEAKYPVLLSNGNLVSQGKGEGGKHWAKWHDPFPKPCYLFALVAGDLACYADSYKTGSGRDVALKIYVQHGNEDKCAFAMDSLIRSMRWDEERFGLEYDLDIFNIVAVDDFNMGAMENKSLNIFNSKCVLASPDTATDADFERIEAIVAHEYFHNWTGNRVTCRDWFQLSLKEGLTVYRDQEFSSDMRSAPVKRIQDVRTLRARQFPEDAGPLSHPIRPESYIEINNFYTATVYEKGAEVIRMMQEILGREGFRKGIDLYFERHDNQAVTCEDFVAAMEDANGVDLEHFRLWYSQAGTPDVAVTWEYDAASSLFTFKLSQHTADTPGQHNKQPLHIPLTIGLLGQDGQDIPLIQQGTNSGDRTYSKTLRFDCEQQNFSFTDVPPGAVPSINRGFSAPVKLSAMYSDDELLFLMENDSDLFNRWEAAQSSATRLILKMIGEIQSGREPQYVSGFARALASNMANPDLDPAFVAQLMTLPSISYISEQMQVADFDAAEKARSFFKHAIATELCGSLKALYQQGVAGTAYSPDAASMGRRALRNAAMDYLATFEDDRDCRELVVRHYETADNMTDRMAALALLNDFSGAEREVALAAFEQRYQQDPVVMDKWFMVQACSRLPDVLQRIKKLTSHPGFSYKNPNKVRALVGAFASANPVRFHAEDGEGYRFLADNIIHMNAINPQVASRILAPLGGWRRMNPKHQKMMKSELKRILATEKLSGDVYEMASKSLGKEA
ncbi:aminopeptidase N [Kiloniella laminariae]|uniref:Aminopeptidase N n=1 Tax=Kiloniella laminariae TaxID=454162 RepID=A0ABT4LI06_9PROT|nr:aminopeptidase N [Kiloniella laminariae]MCZ4280739.1 aminopeptidase N [Kiloniella laminariae]